jgi:hypothetical protein
MPTNQFADQQKRLNSRLDRFNTISKLLSSQKKADRQNAQRKLKAIGRYNGPIDGNQGKGTTAALRAMRGTIDTDQSKLDKRIDKFNASAAQKRKDAAKKRADKRADNARKDSNALYQGALNAGALAVSSTVVKVQVNALNKLDAPAVASKNKELARFTKEIDKIKSEPGAKTKSKALKAATKRRIGAVADKASKAGVTKYKAPVGLTGGGLLFAKGAVLKYAATQTDNELLKGTLDATGNGLMLAGAGTPAMRFTRNAYGANQLNGTHLAKIADAKAIATPAKKKAKAPAKSSAIKGAKSVGRKALKAIPVIGWAATAYFAGDAAYNTFSKTGSVAKAATAGADELTMGAVTKLKSDSKKSRTASKSINSRRKQIAQMRAKSRISVSNSLRTSKTEARSVTKSRNAKLARRKSSNGLVKAHFRNVRGKRIKVQSFKRK